MPSSKSSPDSPAVLVLVGPTAVGKTAVAVVLAERFGGEIINCDSMQVYRGFDIGTDKPGPDERRRVPHHLLDVVDGRTQFTAADFASRAAEAITGIIGRGRRPIVAGGTGLYMKALFDGLFPGPSRDDIVRSGLDEEARRGGLDVLYDRLAGIDPAYAAKVGRADRVRIVRALEVHAVTGIPLSVHFERTAGFLPGAATIKIGLRLDREELRRRIDARVERMFQRGLVEEVRGLLAGGIPETAPPFKALGYRHVLRILRGEMTTDEAVAATKIETRRYAKRQMTWFRKAADVVWFDAAEPDRIGAFVAGRWT